MGDTSSSLGFGHFLLQSDPVIKTLLVVLHTDEGRLILMGDELKIVNASGRETRTLAPGERERVLREYFKLQSEP